MLFPYETPAKTNLEPEDHSVEKENCLPNLHFEFPAKDFLGVQSFVCPLIV